METITGNRVEEKLQTWERTAHKYVQQYPSLKSVGMVDARMRFYRDILKTYQDKDDLTVAEKERLEKMRSQMQQLNHRGQPGPAERWLAGARNPFTKFLYEFIKGAREIYFQPWRQAAAQSVPVIKAASNRPQIANQPKKVLPTLSKQAVLDHIGRSLKLQGFSTQLPVSVLKAVEEKAPSFTVNGEMNKESQRFTYQLQFNRDNDTGRYFPDRISGAISKTPNIGKGVLAGVNVADLDNRMGKVDWQKDYADPGILTSANQKEHRQNLTNVNRVFKNLFVLLTSNDADAVKAHDKLVYKHFSGTPAEQTVPNMSDIRRDNEVRVSADLAFTSFKPDDLFNIANGGTLKVANYLDETTWYRRAKGLDHDEINVLPVHNTIAGSTEEWLKKQGVVDIAGVQQIAAIANALEAGALVKATVVVHGVRMERMMKADPDGKGILIDLAASEKEGLYKPEKVNLREAIEQYQQLRRRDPLMEESQVTNQVRVKR